MHTIDLPEEIGRGSYGQVIKAVSLSNGEMFAKKIAANPVSSPIILNEFQILQGLRHEYIIKVFDSGADENGRSFFLMEFASDSLYSLLCEKFPAGLPTSVLFACVTQIGCALEYLMQNNIAHRDIKPGNILAFYENTESSYAFKLCDFGSAKPHSSTPLTTLSGTPGYLPLKFVNHCLTNNIRKKENWKIAEGYFAAELDFWQLGITYYNAATNALPFGQDFTSTKKKLEKLPKGAIAIVGGEYIAELPKNHVDEWLRRALSIIIQKIFKLALEEGVSDFTSVVDLIKDLSGIKCSSIAVIPDCKIVKFVTSAPPAFRSLIQSFEEICSKDCQFFTGNPHTTLSDFRGGERCVLISGAQVVSPRTYNKVLTEQANESEMFFYEAYMALHTAEEAAQAYKEAVDVLSLHVYEIVLKCNSLASETCLLVEMKRAAKCICNLLGNTFSDFFKSEDSFRQINECICTMREIAERIKTALDQVDQQDALCKISAISCINTKFQDVLSLNENQHVDSALPLIISNLRTALVEASTEHQRSISSAVDALVEYFHLVQKCTLLSEKADEIIRTETAQSRTFTEKVMTDSQSRQFIMDEISNEVAQMSKILQSINATRAQNVAN